MNRDLFKNKFRIPSSRLPKWDYSSCGWYFITICVKDRKCVLGDVVQRKIYLSKVGEVVNTIWKEITIHYPNVDLDEHIIMPNHLHGIIIISRDGACPVSTLGNIIGSFKSASTRQIHLLNHNFSWQSSFYDHIIRNENSLNKIREYIKFNPLKWDIDEENPKNII